MSACEREKAGEPKPHLALMRPREGGSPRWEWVPAIETSLGDIVCRTLVAGVCGTDLQILRGLREDPARILGHEGLAVVERVTRSSDEGLLGVMVAINPTPEAASAEFGHTLDGMMQQRFRVPERLRPQVVIAPAVLDAALAVLAEPLASVMECATIVRRLAAPTKVLVIGRGTIGQLLQLTLGADVPSIRGVIVTGTGGWPPFEAGSFDLVVVCGSRERIEVALDIALSAVRDGGILHIFGGVPTTYRHPELPQTDLAAVRARHTGGKFASAPAERSRTANGGKWLQITGHRGTSNFMLARAMDRLASEPNIYRPLLKILSDPRQTARVLSDAISDPTVRDFTKLGIDMRAWDA